MTLRAATLATAAALALPGAGQACVIFPPSCDLPNGDRADLVDYEGDALLVSEGDIETSRLVLVHCPSRQALFTARTRAGNEDDWYRLERARNRMQAMLRDDTPQTLSQVKESVEEVDVPARLGKVRAGYCGCDLIGMPFSECPPLEGDG